MTPRRATFRVRIWRRTGFRGLFLLLLGLGDIGFSLFVRFSDRPEYARFLIDANKISWLLWLGTGTFLLTGVLNHRPLLYWPWQPRPPYGNYDRWQFAAAVFLKTLWACEYVRLAVLDNAHTYVWGIAGFWLAAAGITFLASAWPEPARLITPPPPDPGSPAVDAEQRARNA